MLTQIPSAPPSRWSRLITWVDRHCLLFMSLFLLIFIPLYPKLPLFEAIPGYLVRVRLEDLLVLGAGLVWLAQVVRGRARWPRLILTWVIIYAGLGLLSVIFAVLITRNIPLQPLHIGKSLLHYFRYLEYLMVFFLAFAGLTRIKHTSWALLVLTLTVLLVSGYGFGQKYWHWPLYSTMNREFSKGVKLYLTEYARVQSTFGGHYDLSAFLVICLPILGAAFLKQPRPLTKLMLIGCQVVGAATLVLTGSKTSWVAYILAMMVVIGLWWAQKRRW